MQFIREADPQLGPHADLFRKHVSMSVCVCVCVYHIWVGNIFLMRKVCESQNSSTSHQCFAEENIL